LKECEISKPHAEAKTNLEGEDKNNLHFLQALRQVATPTSQATTKYAPLVVPSFYKPSLFKFKKKSIMRKKGVLQLASQPGLSQCPCVRHDAMDASRHICIPISRQCRVNLNQIRVNLGQRDF
jgi:hypothetical protein